MWNADCRIVECSFGLWNVVVWSMERDAGVRKEILDCGINTVHRYWKGVQMICVIEHNKGKDLGLRTIICVIMQIYVLFCRTFACRLA